MTATTAFVTGEATVSPHRLALPAPPTPTTLVIVNWRTRTAVRTIDGRVPTFTDVEAARDACWWISGGHSSIGVVSLPVDWHYDVEGWIEHWLATYPERRAEAEGRGWTQR